MISLSTEMRDWLIKVAEATGHSESALVNAALTEYLGDLEDVQIAGSRLALVRAGLSLPIPLEDVTQAHGTDKDDVAAT